jgi:type III pantothenate kinase
MSAADIVVDVGNSRVKWGRCGPDSVVDSAALPADAPDAWVKQLARWNLHGPMHWALTGVHPLHCLRLADWARRRGDVVEVIERPDRLPLRVLVEQPDCVGIDRLLDAVAANSRRRPNAPAVIIDAGSAVTVDALDTMGAFVGGAILPGLRLMAHTLHDHTALLPLIDVPPAPPRAPGASTPAAMAVGIFWAVVGGVRALTAEYAARLGARPDVFLTGGDAALLHSALGPDTQLWLAMTLEGIRLTVAA